MFWCHTSASLTRWILEIIVARSESSFKIGKADKSIWNLAHSSTVWGKTQFRFSAQRAGRANGHQNRAQAADKLTKKTPHTVKNNDFIFQVSSDTLESFHDKRGGEGGIAIVFRRGFEGNEG